MSAALEYLPGVLVLAGIVALILAPLSAYRTGIAQQAADDGEGAPRG